MVIFTILFLFLVIQQAINKEKRLFFEKLNEFITKDGENLSPLETIIIGLAQNIGSQTAISIRAQLQQAASVDARKFNGVKKGITQQALTAQSPLLGMFAPKIMEWLGIKSDDIMPLIMQNFKAKQQQPSNNNEEVEDYSLEAI